MLPASNFKHCIPGVALFRQVKDGGLDLIGDPEVSFVVNVESVAPHKLGRRVSEDDPFRVALVETGAVVIRDGIECVIGACIFDAGD